MLFSDAQYMYIHKEVVDFLRRNALTSSDRPTLQWYLFYEEDKKILCPRRQKCFWYFDILIYMAGELKTMAGELNNRFFIVSNGILDK